MKNFLIGHKLWRIVTGDIIKPTKEKDETDTKFADRLEEWENYDSAKEVWDFLANRYQTTGLAHYYQLWTTLHSLKQGSSQSVNDFLSAQDQIWNQLSQAKISEDHLHLFQNADIVMLLAHILEHCPTHPPRPKGGFSKSKTMFKPSSSSMIVAAATTGFTFVLMSDLEEMVKQVISSNPSTAMSATLEVRFDACRIQVEHDIDKGKMIFINQNIHQKITFGANPTVYELDKIPNGKQIEKALVQQLGCQPSVPAVFIAQEFVGGDKQVMSLQVRNELGPLLMKAGAIWI
uniref:Uncharacterized protein n=1 Tax=Salix viminalis TaxID=40686 RepID=A0A6N2NEZ0_SALVM